MRRTLPAIGRASQPWLGGVGLSVVSTLFVFSGIAIARYTVQHDAMNFIASRAQFAWSATCLIVLVTAAFFLPKPELSKSAGEVPSPWIAGIVALLACSLFIIF